MASRGTQLANAGGMLLKQIQIASLLLLISSAPVAICGQGTVAEQSTQSPQRNEATLIDNIKEGRLPTVIALLSAGTSPDATDGEGGTALGWAIRANNPDILRLLLAQGATVDKVEDDGGTALDVAAVIGRAEMVKLLLAHGADTNHKDKGGHTPLMSAAMGAMFKGAPLWMMKAFLPETDNSHDVISAMGSEHQPVAKLLLDAGADVDTQADDCGLTALMIAAMSGNVDLAKILLAHRAKVRTDDSDALKLAEAFESPEGLQRQLEELEDIEQKQALLNWVQLTSPGRREIAKMLKAQLR